MEPESLVGEAETQIPGLGDFNSDGCVGQPDYDLLIADVRSAGPHDVRFDLNSDGAVNRSDARTLLGFYSDPSCGGGGTGTPSRSCGLGWELVVVVVLLRRLGLSRIERRAEGREHRDRTVPFDGAA